MQYHELRQCRLAFERFCSRYEKFFPRRDQRKYLVPYLLGLLGPLERKSIEPIALEQGTDVRLLQHFIGASQWDERPLLVEHRRHVRQTLGSRNGVVLVDPTAFPKRGDKSVGVARQWCGQRGKTENCQVGVNLGYASERGHAFLDRRLYLPKAWASHLPRRQEAGIPDDVVFRPAWQLAYEMIRGVRDEGIPFCWVNGDEEFSKAPAFHDLLHQEGIRYIFETPVRTRVWMTLPRGRKRGPQGLSARLRELRPGRPRLTRVDEIAQELPKSAWKTVFIRNASKGPIWVRAVGLRVRFHRGLKKARPEGWLVISETLGQQPQRKFFVSNAESNTSLDALLTAAYSRWPIEQDHGQGKNETGLGHYETRTWRGWHHHTALSFLAHHFLVLQRDRLGEKIPRDDRRGGAPRVLGGLARRGPRAYERRPTHGVPTTQESRRAVVPLASSPRSPFAARSAPARRRSTRCGYCPSKLNINFT
jgi:SRSO17 transposase